MGTLLIVALAIFGLAYGFNGRSSTYQYQPLKQFDINRYTGRWYEIARYDHRFERNLDYVTAEYVLKDNGKLEVINRGYDKRNGRMHESVGKAKLTDVKGHLKVSFFLFFYSDYDILALGDNYQWVLIGSSSPKYLWIMSRTPTLPAETLEYIIETAQQHGYDTSKLIYPLQMPEASHSDGSHKHNVHKRHPQHHAPAAQHHTKKKKVKEPVA